MKIGPVGAEFLQTERRTGGQTDRQTDRRIDPNSHFSQLRKQVRKDPLQRRVQNIE